MASFLQQLRLLLWKNGLSVIRQPAWSLALLVWPLVIFIILAITRSQFPPKLTDTCYVAPRNLPSAGFFPFLQTLMCNTDSTCTNKSYLTEGQSKSHWYTRHRQRRDAESHSLPTLLHGFPPLAHLQKGGLVHSILKRDASNQELLELWDRMLNSSFQNMPNVTSVMHTFNNTALVDQTMESVWESVNVLKKSICSFSMTAINTSASSQNLFTKGSINFCSSNDTVLEASLLTLNQVLTEMLLSNPTEVLGSIGGTVVVLDMLQQETSVWDFLLGLPDLFLKPKDEEILNVGAGELENLNNTLTFLQRTFPQANISTDVTNPVITKVIGFLNYMSGWKGRDVYFKLSDVMTPSSIVLYSSEVKDLINQIKIPLDQIQVLFSEANFRTFLCNQNINASYCWSWEASQIFEGVNTWKVAEQVLLAWSQTSASADLAFTKEVFGSFLGLVSPSSLDAVLKHSRSQRSSDAQPQSLAEQLIFGLSNSAFDFLQGMPGWEYIQTFMMAGHSSMQVARVAIEVQLPFIDVVLKDAKYVQEAFLSLMQNETFANAWADHAMDSTVQTVAKVLEGHTSCKDLFAPWAWMSTYSSINFQLWGTLVCAGNDTRLEEMLLTSLLPVNKKVQQLVGVVNGTVMYNVTPSILMAEWHSLYTISLQYVTALQKLQTELNEDYFAAWIPGNISIGLSQILLTSVTGIFENMGSPLENSSLWPSIEPYFHMAYWILTYQPNATASPNCTLTPTAFTCQTGFTWETAVPLIHSLISKVSREPASLLRPLQGTVALLQNSYLALLQQVIANGLPGQLLGSEISLKDLLLDLINTVDKEIQLLSNIDFTQQFDTQLLNDIMAALGLGQIENLLSGGSQTTSMHPVIMGILQVLNNGSIQILNKEEGFAVLQAILSQLGAILPPEQQYQLEAGLNKTHDLIRDLEICSALGQDCVADIQNVFDNLGAMLTFGNNITMPTTHLWGNMTLPVALDVLALLLPWNMSLPAEASMEISRKIQYLLEHAYASPIFNISQSLQASNLTISELEQVNSVFHSNWSVSILETLNMAIQIPQCVNTQTAQSPQKPPVTRQAECVLQLIQTASGLLEVIPVANNAQITLKNWLNITAVEYQKLNNMSTSGSGPLALTEEVLITTLSAIRQNLQGLDVENITDITNELNILEDLLKNVFREQYTYHTINSTLMEQGQYAQKVYGEITLWYLNKLGNYTSGSMFAEILHQLKQMTEMQVALINAKADMVTLTMNQIQNLNHVRLPLEGEDLVQVGSTIMTLLQGEMALIKGNLEIQQTYYNSLGSQMNISIPAEIEGQIMTYLTLTREWITNPQVMTALARIFQWEISSVDITTAGKDLELLLQAMAPLLSPEDRAFIAVAEQVSQAVNYTLLLASTDGGLQSENFTEAVISTVRVVLESISNETGALPQDVVNNILGAFKSSLQLILNSNMSYAQAITLTQGTIQMVDAVIHTLLPAEAVVVLVPIKNSILSYLNNISQPAGFDQWNELIMNVLTELQNSLPSNNTAQPIISTIIKVTENLLSSNEGNLTKDWIINQHLTIALDKIFQGNVSSVDLAGAGVNLDQLLQAMAPLLSPEDRAFLDVAEQVSQALTYASHVASTDGGLQSENFTEAVISTVRVVLESISNETGALPQDVVNNILGAFNGSLQLILNSNMSYAQAITLTQETVQMVDSMIHFLLPAEVAEVLFPIKYNMLSYLNNISQPAGFDQWNELIMNVLTELQNSLPSNNTAQPIISTIIKVTENLLSSNEGNLTRNWIINQHLTIALDKIFQGNVSSVDLAGAGVNLEQLLQAMAPLLSPEDRAFLDVAEQVSQALTYALQVASTDGGLQSENFTEALINTFRVVLESISNETGALPQDVVNNILDAFNGSLQLILHPKISYAQARTLTQGTIQMVDAVIHTLLPAEVAEVLVPIKNSILSYLNNISQPAGFDQWNELIMNVLTELQNSLPSNNTAQPIISTILKVTENLLSSNESNLTKDWIINQHLTIALDRIFQGNVSSVDLAGAGVNLEQLLQAMAPLLSPEDRAFLDVAEQVSQALTYASHVASTDGGLQSENFTEAVISTVRVVLESISNETGALPQDVVNNILGAFNGSLQLILNSNISYAQASTLTQGTIQMVETVIHTLLPAEAVVVLVPIKNSILSYLNNISQPAGFDQWNELIMNVLTELQNSLPSNNTAQPIISTIIKVTENLLSSNEGNLTRNWIINQHLTIALDKIFQGNVSSVDLAGAGVNLDQLLQAMAPLLSPEDRAFLDVAEQVSQALTYASHVASTDGGLQSENFTEAVISTVRVVLESISNETGALPRDVINNILGAFNGSLQLILNPNIYYMQANHLTQETVQMLGGAIHGLLPAEVAEVLVPMKNSILAYLQTISQSSGPNKLNEVIVNMMRKLQNSLPSNNTAQPIISVILKVTEYLLNSNEEYTNMWHNLGNFSLGSLNEITEQLAVFLGSMSPFMNESAQTVTESVGVLVQILSGSADQLTFDKLEDMLAALFSTFKGTPMWDSLPSVISTIHQAIVNSSHNMQTQTELLYVLQEPMSNLLSAIFHVMNTSNFTSQSFVGGLPQALVSTAEAALQAGLGGQSLNCSYMQQIWQDVRAGAGSEDTVALWCNISLLPVIAALDKPAPDFNMTEMAMNPLWINATAGMMAESLETFYEVILNSTFASNHLTEVLLQYTSMLSNLSVLEITNQTDWNVQLFQMQLYQSLSSIQMALDQIKREAPLMTPYIEAAGKTIEVILQNFYLLQNSTASPQIIMQALEITLTGMNFTKETINYILSGDIFMNPNGSTVDSLIKEVIQQIIGTGLLGDWPTLYGVMQQILYLEDTSGTLWKTVEFFNWLYNTQETGLSFVLEILRKLYEIVRDALTKMPLPCFSETFIDLFGNVLYMLKQIKLTSDLFDPVEQYLSPLKMEIARGQNLQGLVSNTRNARRIAREVQREPVDDFLDLLDIDYQALLKVLSIPPTSTEIMETIHVFFANPDLGVILKGYLKEMTGGTSQEETIDTALNVLSYLTLPSNGQQFLEMFMDIGSEGWRVQDLDKVEKLAESLGRTIDMAMVLSDQPPLNIPQRIEHMAQQLQASVSNIISQDGNSTNTAIQFLTALNSILTENFEESKDISPQVTGILQNIIGSFSSPGSQMSIESYLAAVDQTAEAFTPLLSGEVAVYFNISGQMMQAFALLEAYPGDIEKVMMSTSKISNSLNRVLALLNITTLQNGQYVQEVTHPLILSSAMATHILFNLSMSNYSLSSNAEREMLLTQTFNQMVVVLPTETHMYLFSIQSALFTALSKVSSTAEITSQFPEISQLVTQSLLNSLNITHDPTSTHMTPDGLVYILMTVSNQVSMSLYKGLMLSGSPVQISQAVNSLSEVGSSIYSIMPVEGQPYINITLNLMETISSVLNDTSTFGDVSGAVSQVVSSVNSLLAMVHHVNTNSSSSIISDLERTLKTILMIIQTDQSPLTQTADITQQLLHTIQNFISLGNSSSLESELPKMVLGASSMNIGHLLRINDTNWTDKLPLLLTNLANSLPEDLQYSPLIKSIMRSLANESQENLHLLQQVLNTTFELGSANSVNESSDKILDHLLTKVCALENMATVQLITSFLPLGPRLLCDTVVPTIQAFHVLTTNLVNQSTDIYDLIFQTFVGDPSTYNTEVDWTSILSEIVGFNVSTLKTLNINITSPAEVKVFELLKNVTLFVEDVERYTSFPPRILQALLDYPLPRNNIQIFAWLANLRQCSDPSSLQLDPTGQEIFSTFCNLTHEWYSITVIFLRHVDTKAALFRLVLSKEIQDLVGIMLELVKFLTDIMHKLVPAINKLQEYLTNIGELNLVANQEFHSLVRGKRSTMSSRATFSTIARALCKNGILTLFAIAKVPIVTETDPSVQTDHKREELIEKFKIPQDASPFCMNLYLDMVNTTGGAVAWAFLKPMLLGQVLYSPDTPVTREIMTKSNSTLHQFGDLKLYASEWIESSSYVMQSADILTKTLPILQNSLRNPFVQNFIQTQTGIDVAQMSSTLSQFSNMTVLLEKNKFIMEQITTLSMLMLNLSSCVNFDRYRAFNSTDELDRQAERLAQNRELYASIIFKLPEETSSSLPPNIDYTIRMNIENVMRTDRARNPFWVKDSFISSTKNQRYNRGFVYLQESIERAIIEMQTGKAMDGPAVQMQAFPYPCFYKDEYLNSLSFAFPMALMTCWVLFVAHFVKKLVHERELRLHEYMKMMGVNPISHFFAWLIESAVFLLVTVIILTIILKAGGILPHSDGFVLFLYLSDYGFSVLAISFLVSSFFDKTNIAGLSGSLIYVICFFPFIVLIHLEDNLSFSLKSALSLFSPTCFSYASQYISRYEKQEEGIQWSNMYISPLAGDTSSFGWLCWLLLIDSVVYFIIGIYIRMVFPGKYGIGLPWYFPVTRSFWKDMFSCCSRTPQKIGRGLLFTNMMQEQNSTNKGKGKSSLAENGEDDFSGLPVGVSLYGLTKTYDNRHAVDNLNLSFYEGHVTSLLGHNGAGKTTTMSLLTGLFAPTSGTIEVYGMDMQTSIDDVRKEMGVCMQYDVLFDHLTTKEHLLLYAQIKAPHLTKQEVNEQVRRILMETDMHSHRHKRVGTLSGGMKRKLSISIAFIGGSRLVVLDEPTTGVDPCSRRSIWDIVLQHKQERTIILSTHHLDEAEVLSDRIAFLERGGLKCCGSPFYLKDKLAKGYNLTLTKKVQTPDSNEKLNIEELRAFIQSYLPDAQQKEGEVGDLVFALPPYTPQNAAAYHSLLTGLDQNLDKLQLGCYGISDTTLEEVFLQLTRDNMEPTESETWSVSESVIANDMFASRDSIPDDLNNTYLGDKASLTGTSNVRGLALTAQRVKAMLLKRVHHSRRDWKGLFSQVLLPVLFVIAAMGLGSIKSDLQHFPKIVLSPALYHIDDQYTFFSNQNPAASGLIDSMMSYPGVDHVCVRDPTDSVCKERPTVGSETWISRGNSSATFTTCKCSNQVQSCPALVYDPPHKRNPSSQIVYNLTGINTEDYLLVTANDFIRNRYGGWDFGKSLPIDLKMDMLDVPENRTLSKVWYNPEGHHTMPAYLNSLNNFILRSSLPPEKRQKYTISISSHPYPGQVQDEDVMVGGLVSILVALCVLTGYSIMTASFVIYEVHEHHTGSKRLQQISGISEPFYWIINFFYDMTLYMIPVVLSVAMIAAFQLPAFTERQNLGAVTLLLVLFGFSTFPWMYLLSAVFKDTEMAFIGYVCINLFISVNTIISTSILYFLGQLNQNDQSIQDVYRTMSNIFLVFPQFSFGNGLMELARVDMQVQILSAFGVDAYKNPFNLDVLGWMFISMFLQGVICFTLRLLLNKTLLRKVRCWKKNVFQSYSPNEDEDVLAERLRVDRGDASADILQVNRLTKVYQSLNKRVQAVKSLSVGIPAGECFGLLGVNGAGKTTTFKMLTGDVSPTDGSAKIRDIDGRMVDIIDCRREGINIGYCPQVDALDDLLTGEEHLYFYARIRGISKREIDRVVNYLLKKLELDYHRHNTSESYSCGTRRKLSTALALIGNPQILLLDEPSSGMDPRSKRHLWKIISEQVMGKCAVVLTSHSMEECEALCTRLAIMVKGQFRCLGSLQHIKNRFGKGFTVKMYLAGASCDVDMISNFMQQNFPSTFLKDHHSNMVEYHVPVAPGGVASIFGLLESNKAVLQIKHFSVSQTTLDEVFINFAMAKTDTDEQEATEGTDIDSLDSYNALDR
ncbi:uncharacterized protein abca12 isoform X10 [Carassius gibelio]|uniref:uncharacterized protein abca12 isoform X8 n=1 Tax=Carassius gibelio TaxID=101364 RepID=UPI0022799E67|nr:uncharacterized protein abca12 isoform X8 [Carassius gibelio]XP_052462834.1 uncharacterized protein abca12 isoform X10 [Carassius gibelio]